MTPWCLFSPIFVLMSVIFTSIRTEKQLEIGELARAWSSFGVQGDSVAKYTDSIHVTRRKDYIKDELRLSFTLEKDYEITKIIVDMLQCCDANTTLKTFQVYIGQQYCKVNNTYYQDEGEIFCSNFKQKFNPFHFNEKTVKCQNSVIGRHVTIVVNECETFTIKDIKVFGNELKDINNSNDLELSYNHLSTVGYSLVRMKKTYGEAVQFCFENGGVLLESLSNLDFLKANIEREIGNEKFWRVGKLISNHIYNKLDCSTSILADTLRITNINNSEISHFVIDSELNWFKTNPEDVHFFICQKSLPVEAPSCEQYFHYCLLDKNNRKKGFCSSNQLGDECEWPCKGNFYGAKCQYQCAHCKHKVCSYVNGKCLFEECEVGWTGNRCDIPITKLPSATTNSLTTELLTTETNEIVHEPEKFKHEAIVPLNLERVTEQSTIGNEIKHVCLKGRYYGPKCDIPCGHCRYDISCNSVTGECPDGLCDFNWTGGKCDKQIEATACLKELGLQLFIYTGIVTFSVTLNVILLVFLTLICKRKIIITKKQRQFRTYNRYEEPTSVIY
ncbi:DgyrCDS10260 [Dimorphilus gyrociliatus]|uniref:DgyrCDS10260 n=1 Tax=Dimorphilus gyrociliatus TaxID=2664684 RepID=A0A7I8W4S3_9ANNE|nr:DgyrCDS10260 [Dimorphilus gyrociliatus]